MPQVEVNEAYAGVGKVFARRRGAASTVRPRHVGNCSLLNVKQTLTVQEQKDFTRAGGGTLKRRARLDKMEIETTFLSFIPENLTLALAGTSTDVPQAAITDEEVKLYKGELVRLAHPPKAITDVKKDGATASLVAGTDYVMSPGGILVTEDADITDGDTYEVDYTHLAYAEIEAATGTSTELELFFEGLNDAETLEPMLVDFWRVDFPSAQELALISENLGELRFTCEVMKDDSRPAGKSAFMRIQKAHLGSASAA